ncbi:chorismate-binding protein [Prolixibacteraceae bacterium Z1-6]|uniref:Chorismate-binding protein n=1 Tax=Draconibacterium aestuarii TaxID=2998507 RepID=A0A9X3J509_9BACT|nr:chorismate-binding protein [Prolixibacteraceae bacterium Z1-6]
MQITSTEKISVSKGISVCLEKNLIFAAYRLPNQQDPEIVIQKSPKKNRIHKDDNYYNLKGFLVAPFAETEKYPSFIISPDIYASKHLSDEQYNELQSLKVLPVLSDESHLPVAVGHDDYLGQIENIIGQIEQGNFEKVVLSRVKVLPGNYISRLAHIFDELTCAYPNAFIFIFNAGPHLWIGATPEPLLKAQNGTMHTVSLAGTRAFSEQNLNIGAWNSKERLEQEYVTRYISKVLSKFNLADVELVGPYTKQAGNLVHLRTDFSFRSEELKNCLGKFLKELQPTPAVCGMPRIQSLELIAKLEKHERAYYAGFIGPLGLNNRLSIFVNIRCMKVLQKRLALFVGGGITADSDPEDEWKETELKAETLISVLRKVEE